VVSTLSFFQGSDTTEHDVISFFNELNRNPDHFTSSDDICTPMECVKLMIDYLPEDLWGKKDLRILDPCSGNGNFGAYCRLKTADENIYYNELNPIRYQNCIQFLNPINITNSDFFDVEGQWDLIMANPPYSGGGNKNRGLSNQFIEKSIDLLSDEGYLCFVTPNNWMTFNNNNTTLAKLLSSGSFLVIDNDVKKYFPGVGSSFTVFVWQKGNLTNKTLVINSFLKKDVQQEVIIPRELPFIPLYISQAVIDIIPKCLGPDRNSFDYRCDLHNFTQKAQLSDEPDQVFRYRTIHTMRKTRYATKKQDIYEKWNIIVPLSTYYVPVLMTNVNTTQSVGYVSFDDRDSASRFMERMTAPHFKLLVHLTRYGNFNNLKVLKHLRFGEDITFTKQELVEIEDLVSRVGY
jgi:adenine-specific DNA-methyltransferase